LQKIAAVFVCVSRIHPRIAHFVCPIAGWLKSKEISGRVQWGIGISNAIFQESRMYPMIGKRSNARATPKNPWFVQHRRLFSNSARLNSTPSERLPERRPN